MRLRLTLLLASTSLAAAHALAQVPPGEPPITAQTKISGGVRPPEQAGLRLEHVDLTLAIDPAKQSIQGSAMLTLATANPIDRLLLDLADMFTISGVTIDGKPLAQGSWSNPDGRLTIRLPHTYPAGSTVTARIDYGGTPHVAVRAPWDDGFVWSKTPSGAPWIATTSEGYGCDLYWPCLDFPEGEPRLVDLRVTVPEGLTVVAGGVLVDTDTLADGRTTWHWRQKSPNPYSVALSIGPYARLEGTYASRYGNKIPMYLWYLPEKKAQAPGLFAEFAPTLDFFETLIGPYPFGDEKMGVVETPHMGMEHQTANAYGNDYAKAPEGFDWLFQHEFSHEWFGNQLTAANWDDYWLHEGYGEYMQPLYGRWREGEARYAVMMEELRRRIQNRAPIVSGKVRTEEEVYEDSQGGAGQDIYYKGAWVLHTLRNLIGDKAFFDVTRRIVYGRPDPRPGNFAPRFGSTKEFIQIVRDVTGADYQWFFDVYLYSAALPELIETRDGDTLALEWKTPVEQPFPLPVEVSVDGAVTRLPMTDGRGSITVPTGAHVVIDPMARILRRSIALEQAQAWRAAHPGRQ